VRAMSSSRFKVRNWCSVMRPTCLPETIAVEGPAQVSSHRPRVRFPFAKLIEELAE
jgi:hypothetical protein